jgi:hypothetical protein
MGTSLSIPAKIGRTRLEQTPAGLRIIIPAFWRYRFFQRVIFRPLVMAFVIWYLWRAFPGDIVFTSLVTAFAGAVVVTQLAWRAFGREILTVDKAALTLRVEIAGFGWTRRYYLKALSGLKVGMVRQLGRTTPVLRFLCFNNDSPVPWSESAISIIAGLHMYSYNPRWPRFGRGLSEEECQELIGVIENWSGTQLAATHPALHPDTIESTAGW